MSITLDDFFSEFCEREIKAIKLKSWKGKGDGVINFKGLNYSVVARFKAIKRRLQHYLTMQVVAKIEDKEQWSLELENAEDYLLKNAMCDENGKLLFNDDKVFKKWKECVIPEIAEEIILHISLMNQLDGDFEGRDEIIESYKKK